MNILPPAFRRSLYTGAVTAVLLAHTQFAQAVTDPQIIALREGAMSRDIEDVVIAAKGIADQIGAGQIKLNEVNVKTLSKQMADEILGKTGPFTNTANRQDELGELAAFILAGIDNNPKMKKFLKQKTYILLVAKGVLKSAKTNVTMTTASDVFRDVAGSIALTISNNPTVYTQAAKLQKFLDAKAKAIAGLAQRSRYRQGNAEGFGTQTDPQDPRDRNLKYEDGNIPELGTVKDPETDQRNA
jgi:hypothetical protein